MEKFGIFELLDALSAITASEGGTEGAPTAADSAYQPPVYNNPQAAPQPAEGAASAPPPRAETDALAGFYARHDAIARKAGKKQ